MVDEQSVTGVARLTIQVREDIYDFFAEPIKTIS
jgi:hypothetical protein